MSSTTPQPSMSDPAGTVDAPAPQKTKANLAYLIQDVRNARANLAILDPADVSAKLEISDNLTDDLLLLADEIAECENQAKALDLYEKDIKARRSRLKSTANTLREIILQAMDMNDISTIPGVACTISKNRLQPGIIVTNEVSVPSRFFNPQPHQLDMAALKEEFKRDGELFPGCDLDNGKITLTIRRK